MMEVYSPEDHEDYDIDKDNDYIHEDDFFFLDYGESGINERQWLFNGAIPKGVVTLIHSPGGVGKSTFARTLALSLITGRTILPAFPVEVPQPVCLLSAEDSEDTMEINIKESAILHGIPIGDNENTSELNNVNSEIAGGTLFHAARHRLFSLCQVRFTLLESASGTWYLNRSFDILKRSIREKRERLKHKDSW